MRSLISIAGAIAASLSAAPVFAQTSQDAQFWFNVTVQGGIRGDAVYFAEVQPRFGDDASRLQQLILRPAIGVRLSPRVTLYQGYAHVALPQSGASDRNEDRSFQQVSWTVGRIGRGELSSRTRFEQRWLSNGEETGLRLREMARYVLPLGRERGGVAALGSVEGFVALNDTDWGARAGFDQVRTFLGFELPVRGGSTVEAGYLNQIINDPGGRARVNHVASISLFVRR